MDTMTNESGLFPDHVQQLLLNARIPTDQLKPVYYELTIGDFQMIQFD
jgi:hypothetical protein